MGTSGHMGGMSGMAGMQTFHDLQNATGEEFNKMWVSQMLTMHEAKVTELETASRTIRDSELTAIVTRALPKVRAHRDMLAKMNGGTGTGSRGTGSSRQ
jgi:predicted outer membrane protein